MSQSLSAPAIVTVESLKPWVRPSIWIAILGAGCALIAAVRAPTFSGHALDEVQEFAIETVKYLGFACSAFSLFWVALDRFMRNRRLSRPRWPKFSQVVRETVFSICTQVTFITIDIWTAFFVPQSDVNSYADISEYGWGYYVFTLVLVFILHDTYFYWMHRLVHQPALYNRIHRVHHESTDPTPFTAFHFHPLEAFAEGAASIFMLSLFVTLPWHESIPYVWGYGQLAFNVLGHLGYETYPRWWLKVPVIRWKTTVLHHYLHHQMVRGNYSLYFRWWDVACRTEFPFYESRFNALFERRPRNSASDSSGQRGFA